MNISDVLLNLFMSIWLSTLCISWCSRCRRATSLSHSSRSYSFENIIVSTHWWSISVRWISFNPIYWFKSFDDRCLLWIFLISVTMLIWILSTILVLIYSVQIKFFIYNSWILKTFSLIWSDWSLHRIIHNVISLSFQLTSTWVSKLQTYLSRLLRAVILALIINSFLIHVSSSTINNTCLWDSVILMNSTLVHSFYLLGINLRLFWNMLIDLLLASYCIRM